MEGIQGAVLEVKLKHLDAWNRARREHADHYRELLADVPGIELPTSPRPEAHVWHLFVILTPDADRDRLRAQLWERGIATGVHYPTPVPLQPAYAQLNYQTGDLPVAEDVMRRCLSLPMFPEMTREQISSTVSALRECLKNQA
jgi:dTDP-4-amino-4,6-dideoxygalactose transaminase